MPDLTPEVLRGLLESVEKATGEDRELDESFAVSFRLTAGDEPAEHYTASIDSALALVDRLKPECEFTLECRRDEFGASYDAGIFWWRGTDPQDAIVRHKTAPLAILAALLKSLAEPPNADT